MYSKTSVSCDNIEMYLFDLKMHMQKKGVTYAEAAELAYPIDWYIGTGRASCEFMHKLIESKLFIVARKLMLGGTIDEAIGRVKEYLGYESC